MKYAKIWLEEVEDSPYPRDAYIDYRALKKVVREARLAANPARSVDGFYEALRAQVEKANAHMEAVRLSLRHMTSEEQQALLSLRQVNETSLRKIKKKFWKALPEAGATLAELPLLQPAFPLAERDEEVTQEGEGAPECFVCCSSAPPLYRPCKCSTLVHHACLAKLCKTLPTYKSRCAVCHEPFPVRHTTAGVRFVEERANVLIMASAYGCVLAMLTLLGLAVLVCFLTGLGPAFQTRLSLATAIPALLSLVMLCILHRKHHLQTGRWWPFALQKATVPILVLSNPTVPLPQTSHRQPAAQPMELAVLAV